MKKIYTLGLVSLSLFLGASCSKNADTEPSNSQTSSQKLPKHTATINLSAAFSTVDESLRAYLKPTEDQKIKIEFKPEELMTDGVDASGKPIRVLGSETGKLTFFFVKKEDPTNVIGPVHVNPTDFREEDGKYVIRFLGTVSESGLDFSSGEWYISGGYRLTEATNKTGNMAGYTYLDAEGKLHSSERRGSITDFKMPFVFGWTKLATRRDTHTSTNYGQNLALKMIPDGYMMRIRAINNLVEDIDLKFLAVLRQSMGTNTAMETKGYDYVKPPTTTAGDLVTSNTPRVPESTYTAGMLQSRYALGPDKTSPIGNNESDGVGLVLEPGDYYPIYQRFNSPTDLSNASEGAMVFHFKTKDRALGTDVKGASIDSRDITGLTGAAVTWVQGTQVQSGPVLTDDWRGGTMFEKVNNGFTQFAGRGFRNQVLPANTTFSRGKVNNVNFKINSDLMITELYTTRYDTNRKGSFGLIEIYNPTLDEIDLSKYALLRIGYRNDGTGNKIRVLPSSDEADQTAQYSISNGNRIGSGGFIIQNAQNALLLPLDMNNGTPAGKWAINSFNQELTTNQRSVPGYRYNYSLYYNNAVVATPKVYSGFDATVVDFSGKNYITGLESISAGNTKLKPGKTMIILFSGFASSTYTPTQEEREIFTRIQEAVTAGYCQYVVAIAQGAGEPHTATAGVTTADIGDSFSLVKTASLPTNLSFDPVTYRSRIDRRIFVDGTWTPGVFDSGLVVANLMTQTSVKAILRRPYGPYLWNKGFLPPSDMSSYYQVAYTGASQATFGAPYFSSYDAGKTWSSVVAPKVERRNAALFKSK